MNARATTRIVLIALVALVAGCGYAIHSSLDEQYQTIYVAPFQNHSNEYDLQALLTDAVTRKFIVDGRLKVVNRAEADLVLEGDIVDYRRKGLTFGKNDEPTQFLCVVIARARLTDAKTGQAIWEDRAMSGETSFYTKASGQSSDRLRGNAEAFLATVRSFASEEENRAASEALEQLASDLFYRTIEPW